VTKGKSAAPAQKEEPASSVGESFGRLFGPMLSVRHNIDRFFESLEPEFSRGFELGPFRCLGAIFDIGDGDLLPNMEVSEEKKTYQISVELPGVDEKDISLSLQDHTLTISGEKKSERKEDKKDYYLSERRYGSFRRSFRVPDDVDEDKISAKFDKGVIVVVLPKAASAKTRSRPIPVK